jgi:FkbM family methyltransferase
MKPLHHPGPVGRLHAGLCRRLHQRLRVLRLRRWQRLCRATDASLLVTRLGRDLKIRVHANPRDVVSERIYVDRYFEAPECRFVNAWLQPGMTVVDVGANIGQYTLIAARRVGPTGHVHSFEPNPRMYAELLANVALNGLDARCTLNPTAVTDRAGTATLSLHSPGKDVFSSIAPHRRAAILGHQTVRTVTLADYVDALPGDQRIDFIKMDIEGAELSALRGAERLLTGRHAPTLLIEVSDTNSSAFQYRAQECLDLLESHGYQFHEVNYLGRPVPLRTRSGTSLEVNVIAVPSHAARQRCDI